MVADVQTAGIVGGIDRSIWPFWRAYSLSFASVPLTASSSTIQTMMNRLWLQLVRGTDRPDLVIADNAYFQMYWESLQAIQRITQANEAMAGYQTLKFMDADVVFDGGFQGVAAGVGTAIGGQITWATLAGSPPNHMYFLNTDYIFLRPHRDRNMVPLNPDRFTVNQDAMVKLVAWAGNMTMSNAFLQGVLVP